MIARLRIALALVALVATALPAVTGCRTTPRIDWAARVGTYTHDDAIRELGPPEKSATLSDGSVVADWLESRGIRTATTYPGAGAWGPGYRRGWSGPGVVIVDPPAPDRFLRLSFDPQGKLASWKKVVQ